jgi:hypothetical protein
MSSSAAVYLGVAVVAWGPCVFLARRFVSGGNFDRLVLGGLSAIGWPLSLPLLIAAYVVDRRRPVRRPFRVAVPAYADAAPAESSAVVAPQ